MVQDKKGLIFIATAHEGLFSFDGYKLKPIHFSSTKTPVKISNVDTDVNGNLWVGTENNGVYFQQDNQFKSYRNEPINEKSLISNQINTIKTDSLGGVWIGFDKGITYISPTKDIKNFTFDQINMGVSVLSIEPHDRDFVWVGTDNALLKLDTTTGRFEIEKNQIAPNVIKKYGVESLLIGTNSGLFMYNKKTQLLESLYSEQIGNKVTSILIDNNAYWVGTLYNGLYRINRSNLSIRNFNYDQKSKSSLSDNNVLSLFIDSSKMLWIGTFNEGVNTFSLKNINFGLETDGDSGFNCASSKAINNIYESDDQMLWLATENGVIQYQQEKNICQIFGGESASPSNNFTHPFIYEVVEDGNQLWVSTARGLNNFNLESKTINQLAGGPPRINTFFSKNYDRYQRLIGTKKGLYLYNTQNNQSIKMKAAEVEFEDIYFYSYAIDIKGRYFFATNKGVFYLKDETYHLMHSIKPLLMNAEVLSIHIDVNNNLWVGTFLNGLFLFDIKGKLLKRFTAQENIPKSISVNSIIFDESGLWIGTNHGLLQLNPENYQSHLYQYSDGLQSNFFTKAAAHKGKSGKLYFAGRNGFNGFMANNIRNNLSPPAVMLTDLTRFGHSVEEGKLYDGFILEKSINELSELTLTHKDYVMGFEFSALDYADPSRNQYAYKLEGFDPDWNYVDAGNRNATYTNLPRGLYTFKVKASNSDGVWNEQAKSLVIKVLPAPWLSWWAISFYVLSVLLLAFWLVNRKLQADRRLSQLLKVEVKEKTKELQLQKQTVESLLAKKNELFSNVSHEFRTPLTLILGPMTELIETSQTPKSRQSLTVLKRNANRLLLLVEQLLHLAKTSDFAAAKSTEQRTDQQIKAIIESFQHLATDKKITLVLAQNDLAYISATEQCLDATLGNLISNAIKYAPSGSTVEVSAIKQREQLIIVVSDHGAGLSVKQKVEIFKRFKRLDAHQNIAGIGIGLSVAKELVEINHGSITVESELGVGSRFIIELPTIEHTSEKIPLSYQPGTLVDQLTQIEDQEQAIEFKNELINNKNIVLVIEDNHDMRNHIVDVLKSEYHCLQAKNGREGVATAIKYIPDLIISDVMMPEMDGFKVSRIIRSDQRTSHIPLILLTALNDRENRIKGWREHVDVYMTKPFDREELMVQVENIITIRNILNKKTHAALKKDDSLAHSDLPKKDKAFIEKLYKIIKSNYQDPLLNRDKIASDMAVSDRQLQRKTKALIDQNPMDILREYRLKKGAEILKDGYQVGPTSDDVGFKTPTHFSQCFKAQYGLTPKQYQQQFKKH